MAYIFPFPSGTRIPIPTKRWGVDHELNHCDLAFAQLEENNIYRHRNCETWWNMTIGYNWYIMLPWNIFWNFILETQGFSLKRTFGDRFDRPGTKDLPESYHWNRHRCDQLPDVLQHWSWPSFELAVSCLRSGWIGIDITIYIYIINGGYDGL